jgi:hypothetical protein
MLTGPRINADDVTPSCGLCITCRGEKYVQYYTIIYSRQYLCVRSLNVKKIPYFGAVAISARCKPHSTLVPR